LISSKVRDEVRALEIVGFNDIVSTMIDVLDNQAQKIEDEKLKVRRSC
jgi:hypothetical protein